MDAATDQVEPAPTRGEARRRDILQAAVEQFSARGVEGTSMANIAAAAGVSRPALYQYFANKDEIFASAFVGLFEDLVSRALEALDQPGTMAERLNGFLQRYEGDLWERMSASPYIDEITEAKNEELSATTREVVARLSQGLATHLRQAGVDPDRAATAIELLRLAPNGFRFDRPTTAVFRRRLEALARSVAAGLGAS